MTGRAAVPQGARHPVAQWRGNPKTIQVESTDR